MQVVLHESASSVIYPASAGYTNGVKLPLEQMQLAPGISLARVSGTVLVKKNNVARNTPTKTANEKDILFFSLQALNILCVIIGIYMTQKLIS
jgi:hypothetical protein